jgi:hypothetical protein
MNPLSQYLWLAKIAAVLGIVASIFYGGYRVGSQHIQGKWDAEKSAVEAQAETLRILAQSKINKTASDFSAKAAKDRDVAQSNLAKVDQYAPTNFPPLPGAFRVWHDAAAAGEEVDDSRRANAPSVSLKAVETTIADNYASSNYDKQRLARLQQIVRDSGCFDLPEE